MGVLIISWSMTSSTPLLRAFSSPSSLTFRLTVLAAGAFIVKLPLIGLHIWLPKAHVEAPVVGSMFLAAILLKLGGYGIILFQDSLLLGLVNTGLIAFSSVGHMGLGIVSLLLGGQMGTLICVAILVRHGFSSSASFYAAYIFYKTTSRRRLLLNKNLFSLRGAAVFFWVVILLALIGCPPSINI